MNFIEQSCLPYLRNAQNEDGGWGFMPGAGSRVEPTAWALIALHEFASATGSQKAVSDAAALFETISTRRWLLARGPGTTQRLVGHFSGLLVAAVQQAIRIQP